MILLIIVYTITDFLVTAMNMNHASFYELNPIARWCIDKYGIIGLAMLKICLTSPIVIMYKMYSNQISQWVIMFFKLSVWLLILVWFISWGNFLWVNL